MAPLLGWGGARLDTGSGSRAAASGHVLADQAPVALRAARARDGFPTVWTVQEADGLAFHGDSAIALGGSGGVARGSGATEVFGWADAARKAAAVQATGLPAAASAGAAPPPGARGGCFLPLPDSQRPRERAPGHEAQQPAPRRRSERSGKTIEAPRVHAKPLVRVTDRMMPSSLRRFRALSTRRSAWRRCVFGSQDVDAEYHLTTSEGRLWSSGIGSAPRTLRRTHLQSSTPHDGVKGGSFGSSHRSRQPPATPRVGSLVSIFVLLVKRGA
jgi:hypothetical protein